LKAESSAQSKVELMDKTRAARKVSKMAELTDVLWAEWMVVMLVELTVVRLAETKAELKDAQWAEMKALQLAES
jgi:hypothetical protein